MEKSFYYVISSLSVVPLSEELRTLGIPHMIETSEELPRLQPDEIAIVFPDLPVRQYAQVRQMFGDTGEPY